MGQTNNSNCVVQVQDGTGMEICSANCAGVELVDSTFMIKCYAGCKAVIVVNSSRKQVISVYMHKKNCPPLKFHAEAHIFESTTSSDFLDHSHFNTRCF